MPFDLTTTLAAVGGSSVAGSVVGRWLQRRSYNADVAGQIEEVSGRLVDRQQAIIDRQDDEIREIRDLLTAEQKTGAEQAGTLRTMQAQLDAFFAYLLADAAWHAQVASLLSQAGVTPPPSPEPPTPQGGQP